MGTINQQMTADFTPQKRALFQKAFQVGKNLIYSKAAFAPIVQQVDSNDPASGLAHAIVIILKKIESDPSVGQLPLDVALATGLSLLSDLVDALTQTGRSFSPDIVQQALQKGVQLYLASSKIDPQELQSQASQIQSMAGGA